MKESGADVHIIASLDDTCWLLNVRGDDIDFFPLMLSYSIVTMDSMELYVDERKLDDQIRAELAKNNVHIHPYNDIYEDIKNLSENDVAMIDPMKMNYALYKNIPCKTVECANPTILMKAMKNPVELENIKEAHIKDGVAITKFMYWIKTRYDKEVITELSAADKLTSLRAEQEGYIRDSFEPLCAFADHAAMMHYSPFQGDGCTAQRRKPLPQRYWRRLLRRIYGYHPYFCTWVYQRGTEEVLHSRCPRHDEPGTRQIPLWLLWIQSGCSGKRANLGIRP